jgi:outer membrane immunogenic protein
VELEGNSAAKGRRRSVNACSRAHSQWPGVLAGCVRGGVENSLNIFGIAAPGWFMKTEYRVAEYERTTLPETFVPPAGVGLTGLAVSVKPIVQTVSTSLVYRFNWGGPVVAKY